MKYLILCVLLTGCATNKDFELYLEAQKSISRDATMSEAARISVLIDMTKSSDNQVKNGSNTCFTRDTT